ncbi:unnamed protein product [Brassicogethes aeneus]|uniref:RNA helicase n=1 Tax=Brassicogethes aeneus TaxID=1431903 RepID=A0A9P0B2G5_BRAAE|nr:unnamed protein product [Brassicogethes aeneus]
MGKCFPSKDAEGASYYGLNRSEAEVQEATPEDLRIEIDQIFKDFLLNPDVSEYIFSSNLNNLQRKYIHEKAKMLNIVSKSYGNPPNRKLHIKKRPKNHSCHSFGITPCNESMALLNQFINSKENISIPQRPEVPKQFQDKVYGKITNLPPTVVNKPKISQQIAKFKQKLPVTGMRKEILEMICNNQVLIISSETGSGKTTQIPQFIMEEMTENQQPCKIICTQPRRISTVAVAERVAEERGETLGDGVGYHIRLEQKYGFRTGLIYCTNGILLRSLMVGCKILSSITHLIIDEVHERDRLSDFLLICIKQNLDKFPNLRIILMSATVNTTKFMDYFENAKVLTLPGRQFTIQEYFLDDILINLNYLSPAMESLKARGGVPEVPVSSICDFQNLAMDQALEEMCSGDFQQASAQASHYILDEGVSVDYQHSATGMTALMIAAALGDANMISTLLNLGANLNIQCRSGKNALDYATENSKERAISILNYFKMTSESTIKGPSMELLNLYDKTVSDDDIDYDLVTYLVKSIHQNSESGAILIFLPGYDDIMMCNDRLMECGMERWTFKTFFLHGSMSIRDQHEVFKTLPNNQRKIILSTNIAETSITIDDVVYVVDCGKAKEKSYDSYNKLSSLQTMWISKACVKQRAGRAGRTQPGICFHLFSQRRYSNMDQERVPEILRVSLEELCLHTKIIAPKNIDIFTFLAQAPDPPSANSVKVAIESLQALGALNVDETLTKLGEYLSQFTVEPRLGKMLIYSVALRCLEPVLTLTASLAHKDPFQLPPQANLKVAAAEKRRALIEDVPSDHLIYLKAFLKWQEECQKGRGYEFCREYFISKSTMESILETRRQLLGQLRAGGFIPQSNSLSDYNKYADSWPMVKAAISSGLYPHLAFPNGAAYSTRSEKKVYPINSSALIKNRVVSWVVFDEPLKNKNNFYIRGNTAVSPLTIALVCGNDSESVCESTFIIDKWLEIDCLNCDIPQFRLFVKQLINKVLNNPAIMYRHLEYDTISVLNKVLFIEDTQLQLPQAIGIGYRPSFTYHTERRRQQNYEPNNERHHQGPSNGEVENLTRNFRNLASQERRPNNMNNSGDYQQGRRRNVNNVEKENYSGRNFSSAGPVDRFRMSNPEERYQSVPDAVVYILIKPRQTRSVNIAYCNGTWVFAPQTEKKIIHYYSMNKQVRLIFTVYNGNAFQGIAQFISMNPNVGKKPNANIKWLFRFEVPHVKARQMRNPYNRDRPIFDGVDGQLVEQSVAEELVRVFSEVSRQNPKSES